MCTKKWCVTLAVIYACSMIGIAGLVYIVDPFFHYHAPISGISYSINDGLYQNDGIIKNFDYDAVIIGTSTTSGFNENEASKLFNKDFVRLTYVGEGFKRINDGLNKAIRCNPKLEFVIRGVDPIWFVTDSSYMGHTNYPDYLSDDVLWNDVDYIYNKQVIFDEVVPKIIKTIYPNSDDLLTVQNNVITFDSKKDGSAIEIYERPEKQNKIIEQSETDEFFRLLTQNMNENVFSSIVANPSLTFYIFIPPYSICWWDSLNQNGTDVLKRRINMGKYVIEELLKYDNVRLFSFSNNFGLTCNMDNYIDEIHYKAEVNSKILVWMKNGDYELTKSNYLSYISEITEFYSTYDYDSLFN